NWNFKATANEYVIAVDDTNVAVKLGARAALRLGNLKPMIRRLGGEAKGQNVELPTATATSPDVIHNRSTSPSARSGVALDASTIASAELVDRANKKQHQHDRAPPRVGV